MAAVHSVQTVLLLGTRRHRRIVGYRLSLLARVMLIHFEQ